jgi:hypothetical protein
LYPSLFAFVPKTFILRYMSCRFANALAKRSYIVKPENDSLGQGIVTLDPGSDSAPDDSLLVGQECVDSFWIENTIPSTCQRSQMLFNSSCCDCARIDNVKYELDKREQQLCLSD